MRPRGAATSGAWVAARGALDGLPGGRGLNIAHEAVDRHVLAGRGDVVALRCLRRDGTRQEVTYGELAARSSRFANVLAALGVGAGDVVGILLDRVPDLHVAVLGAFKRRAVVVPLFAAFGPEPVRQRLSASGACAVVTSPLLHRRRLAPVRDELPGLRHVLLAGTCRVAQPGPGVVALEPLLDAADAAYEIPPTAPEDRAVVHFTSGTTGTPKGAIHVHEAVVAHHATARDVLGLGPGVVYWCTADPGWVTGMSYGIIGPLACGASCVVDEADLDARRWWATLERERVEAWYTAPTAIRMLMRAGDDEPRRHDLSALRLAASVGEPLGADAVRWGEEVLGLPFRDTWWQTETGAIMVANHPGEAVRPGSMGRPVAGVEATVLRRSGQPGRDGEVLVIDGHAVEAGPGEDGHLAIRAPWPSMFRGYLDAPDRYERCFVDGWYVSGDIARRDDDGAFWFVGRSDDVIQSAGHLIGPFEVESALLEHPAVVDAGAIGLPDPVAGEVVVAYVSVRDGVAPTEDLVADVLAHARRRLGPAVAPRRIAFDQHLPHTRSGKVARRILRARELGLPLGDTSTVEGIDA